MSTIVYCARGPGCDCAADHTLDVDASCGCRCHDCECECHEAFLGVTHAQEAAHDGRSCREYQAWLDEDVYVQLSSLQNVTYRHVVSTGLTRFEWLDADEDELAEAVQDAVLAHVEVVVLDDPYEDADTRRTR